jgi:hypothetical protein
VRHGDVRLQTSLLAYIFAAEFTASKPIAVNFSRGQFDIVVLFMQVGYKFRYREWDTKDFVARLNRADFTSLTEVSRITFVTASRLAVVHPLMTRGASLTNHLFLVRGPPFLIIVRVLGFLPLVRLLALRTPVQCQGQVDRVQILQVKVS